MAPPPGHDRHLVARWLLDRARTNPDAVAIECRDQRFTYAELRDLALDMAQYFAHQGLGVGDRVATVTENDPAQVALFFACATAGLALVPLNWRLTPSELAAQLDVVSPALVVASTTHRPRASDATGASARAASASLMTWGELADHARAAGATPGDRPQGPAAGVSDETPLLIVFTSGTTGRPKGAVLTNANCFWTNLSLDGAAPLTGEDVVLQVLPQFHVGGWNVQPLQAWWKGATVVLESDFDPDRVLALIERRRVTTMMGVPTTYLRLAEAAGFPAADLTSLRQVIVGGAAMPPDVVATWRERGVAVAQGYGLTEAAPNVFCLAPADATGHPGSVGRPYGFVDVELHDPATGRRVDGAGTGELWVSGPNVFAGYWQDDEATAATMAGAWLRTGDLAERDGDGYYRICGRLKEIYISGGENVYPGEVEAVLRQHPAVVDAAVVGVPDRRWGEVGVAFVQPRAGRAVAEDDLVAHCRQRLAGFKVPRRVVVVDELPRLGTGKLDKRQLAATAAASAAGTEEEVRR